MKLHDAIVKLLTEKGKPLTTSEIAVELNRNKWYSKKDDSPITPFQIHGRTRKYPQLFIRQRSLVSLGDQPITNSIANTKSAKKLIVPSKGAKVSEINIERRLLKKSLYKEASEIDELVPSVQGLYCIRISDPGNLPEKFSSELIERGHNIIYIGQASQSLKKRFLQQELRARGHGTFFRSIGAVLGFKPPIGSLVNKENKRNFKFSPSDEAQIIAWIDTNLLVNWVEHSENISRVESELILKYKPLLNLDHNPLAMVELRKLRAECVRVANQVKEIVYKQL